MQENVVSKIITTSPKIDIFVGPEKETISVHKDLLIIVSSHFRNALAEPVDDAKLTIPEVKPALFADFVSWMYTGSYLQVQNDMMVEIDDPCIELWNLGEALGAPAFQNAALDDYRTWCKTASPTSWPCISGIDSIYRRTFKNSPFRRFAAQSMSCRPPLSFPDIGSEKHQK